MIIIICIITGITTGIISIIIIGIIISIITGIIYDHGLLTECVAFLAHSRRCKPTLTFAVAHLVLDAAGLEMMIPSGLVRGVPRTFRRH